MHSLSWPPTGPQAEEAYAGDIIGLHNHGTINIGDTFTAGRAPHLHRRAQLRPGDLPARGAARIR